MTPLADLVREVAEGGFHLSPPTRLHLCPRCLQVGKRIRGGMSRRTGRAFRSFWACQSGCLRLDEPKGLTWSSELQWRYFHQGRGRRPVLDWTGRVGL